MNANAFLDAVKACLQTHDSGLSSYYRPLANEATQAELARSLKGQSDQSLAKLCTRYLGKQELFAGFTAKYLGFIRDIDWASEDPETLRNGYRSLESAYSHARQIFASTEYDWFLPILRNMTDVMVQLAFKVDLVANDFEAKAASSAARSLTSVLTLAASAELAFKRMAILFLANQTLRIYFHLKNPRMGSTVTRYTTVAVQRMSEYPKSDTVSYLYYTGRMKLVERHLREAANDLQKAFMSCPSQAWRNQRIILIYLTAALLPLGSFPSSRLLRTYRLEEIYAPLIRAVKVGNFHQVLAQLDAWQRWHLKKGNYLLLREKLEVLCWRNLIRKTLFVIDKPQPGKRVVLRFDALVRAAQFAFRDPTIDTDDVECMCVSLIEQGYLKAYVHHSTGQLVLQKGGHFGFPPVITVGYSGVD